MRSIEVEGDDIDQAITKALLALQVERDRVAIDVLSAATRGLLGFGGKKARIRATVRAPLDLERESGDAPREAEAAPVPRETPSLTPVGERDRKAISSFTGPAPSATTRATRFLQELLERLETGCRVAADEEDTEVVVLRVTGPETALVIGRRGQTLDAIEYVVNRIVARDEAPAGMPRFVVDAEGYRERRREYLEELAARVCDKVERTGRPVTLEPMTPRDRRIVHLAVQKRMGLTSRSQGDGRLRSMVIHTEGRRPTRGSGPAAE